MAMSDCSTSSKLFGRALENRGNSIVCVVVSSSVIVNVASFTRYCALTSLSYVFPAILFSFVNKASFDGVFLVTVLMGVPSRFQTT